MKYLALVTGGTSGIGYGVAKMLAPSFDLALAYAKNHEKAEKAKKELSGINPDLKIFSKELHCYDDSKALYDDVCTSFNKSPDILVNCAGRLKDGLFLNTDFSQHLNMIHEHLVVTMALCHLSAKSMYKQKFGRIINLSSIAAHHGNFGQTNYTAAKAGIEGFTKTFALEVAHRGITVNAVAPGLIDTPMTSNIINGLKNGSASSVKAKIPVGVIGSPEDVGSLIAYLCSEDAYYITGCVYTIDGGRSLGAK